MEKTAEKLKVNESLLKTVLCSATFWGLLAHGMVLFNKYSFHDDVRYFNEVGATYESGRWMLGILGSLSANLLGSKNYSLPVVNGTITILCIAAIVYLLVDSLKIQSKPLVILLCGSMVTFPSVTGTFSYMFTAPYYYAASLLGVVGAWIFHQKKNVVALLLCTVLMACSVGVYQANIPVCICTLLLYMMEDIRQSDMNWKAFWKMALCNATVCIGFVTEYFLVNQYFLNQFGVVLTDYKGINHFGRTNLSNYIYRILCGYGSFFYPSTAVEDFSARYVYTLLIIVTAIIAIFVLRKMYILKTPKGCQTLLILIAYPIAACFVYLMVEPWDVHAVMTFGQAFAFALVVWFIDKYPEDRTKVEGALCKAAVALLGVLVTLNIRYSNILYLKADVMQTQMISYYTTLITRIESIEGYTEDAQVVYIGEYDKHDKNLVGISEYFDDLDLATYKGEPIFNDYAWKEAMEFWCGFAPELGDAAEFDGNAEVASMPCYPDQGSIRCINALSDQVKLEENASDFFAISSRVADVLRTNYREKTRFLRGYVQSVGFRKTTLEYTAAERAGGASHYTLKKLMNFAISTIVGFSDFPLKLGLYAGAVSFLAAVIFAISALCGFREYKVILAAVNVLFAVLFLLVGIMGEYFSVAFAELKNRPIYIVEKEINSGHCV